jgi:hypothetical protein
MPKRRAVSELHGITTPEYNILVEIIINGSAETNSVLC